MHGLGKNLAKSSQSKSLELTLPYNSFHLQMCYFSSVFQALFLPPRGNTNITATLWSRSPRI